LKGNNSQVPLEKYKSFDSVTYFVTAYFNTSLVLSFTFLAPNLYHVKNILILHKIHYQLENCLFFHYRNWLTKKCLSTTSVEGQKDSQVPLLFWHFIVLIATTCTRVFWIYDTLYKAGGTILVC